MPAGDLVLENLVDELVLLDDGETLELGARDVDGVHGAATARYICDIELGRAEAGGQLVVDELLLGGLRVPGDRHPAAGGAEQRLGDC